MFRPAGFSDSEDDGDQGFSRRQYSHDEELRTFSFRRARDADTRHRGQAVIPWDSVNNNNQAPVNMSSSDTVISDPALVTVLEKTKKYLRSTLLSHKGGVEMHMLNNDYRELVGEGIPFTKLKFNGLESLLRSLPSVCSLWRSGGEVMVKGVAGEASQHIMNMVSMQKSTAKGKSRKRGKGKKGSMYGRGQSGFEREMDSWHQQFAAPSPPRPYRSSAQPPQRRDIKPLQQSMQFVNERVVPVVQNATIAYKRGVVTTDMVVCGNRVKELLQGRLHGLYVAQVEKMYEKKFVESLSEDWSEKLGASGDVIVMNEAGGLVLVKCGGSNRVVTGAAGLSVADNNTGPVISGGRTEVTDKVRQVGRVKQVLQGRVHGLFVAQVEKMHQKQFGETLPSLWWGEMEKEGSVKVERMETGQVVVRWMME